MDRSRYNPDWEQVSAAARERAGNHCQCLGECGVDHGGRCPLRQGQAREPGKRPVRLTVHHRNADTLDDRPGNLAALCEGCHLRLDLEMHKRNAKATRTRKKGLAPLFGEGS